MAQPSSAADLDSSFIPDLVTQFDHFTAAFRSLAHNIQSRIAQIEKRDKDWAEMQAKVQMDAQKVRIRRMYYG